jgi:hypothetical protein
MAQCSGWGIRCYEKEGECRHHLKCDIEKEDEYGYCEHMDAVDFPLRRNIILKEERD